MTTAKSQLTFYNWQDYVGSQEEATEEVDCKKKDSKSQSTRCTVLQVLQSSIVFSRLLRYILPRMGNLMMNNNVNYRIRPVTKTPQKWQITLSGYCEWIIIVIGGNK